MVDNILYIFFKFIFIKCNDYYIHNHCIYSKLEYLFLMLSKLNERRLSKSKYLCIYV